MFKRLFSMNWLGLLPLFLGSVFVFGGFVSDEDTHAAVGTNLVDQEFYELRTYRIPSPEKKQIVERYLEKGLVPALNRFGLDRVGVFTRMADESDAEPDHSIWVLIPYKSLEQVGQLDEALRKDSEYREASAELTEQPLKDPPYTRIENRLMKAFAGMPVIELPEQTVTNSPRMFELRIYESHNSEYAARKVGMFNDGEIEIMRQAGMAPVFYGATIISNDVPNLTYMLSASDMEAHQEHWKAFQKHPDWLVIKKLDKYKDTVSKINRFYLVPTAYSQL